MNENEMCSYEHFETIRKALLHTVHELEQKVEYISVDHFEYNIIEMVRVLYDVFDSYDWVEKKKRDAYYRDRLTLSAIARCILELTSKIYYYYVESPHSSSDYEFRKHVYLYNSIDGLINQTKGFPDEDVINTLSLLETKKENVKKIISDNPFGSDAIKRFGFDQAIKGSIVFRSKRRGIDQNLIERLYSATSNYIHSNPLSFDYQGLRTEIIIHKVFLSTCVYSFVSMSVLEITEKYKLEKGENYDILEIYSNALKASN